MSIIQPSQAGRGSDVLTFRIARADADALRALAAARGIKLGKLLREHAEPLVKVATDLDLS